MRTGTRSSLSARGPGALASIALTIALIFAVSGLPGASAALGPTDLALTKADSADPVTVGGNFTYVVTVSNQGTNDATEVVVTDTLPSLVEFVSATPSSGTCRRSGGTLTCELGQLNAGATATVSIVVRARRAGTASNAASVTTSVVDANATNNQATETTVIAPRAKKKVKLSCGAPTITGTLGGDTLTGTAKRDVILALDGDDRVFADAGRDLVCAGPGIDFVSGGLGSDILIGGGSRDLLFGNAGNDAVKGKAGRDRLRGNLGNDLLNGGSRRDNCRGGAGRDGLKRCP
jgi:uncharacterized repeat protein (TIGR01451 family)